MDRIVGLWLVWWSSRAEGLGGGDLWCRVESLVNVGSVSVQWCGKGVVNVAQFCDYGVSLWH